MAGADHPVSSRIDVSGSHEGAAANLTVALGNADLEVKPDYDGELRVLHIDAVLNLDIRMYEEEGMDLIADLYSLKKELFPEKEETPYERLLISSTSRCRWRPHRHGASGNADSPDLSQQRRGKAG